MIQTAAANAIRQPTLLKAQIIPSAMAGLFMCTSFPLNQSTINGDILIRKSPNIGRLYKCFFSDICSVI